MMQAAFRAIFRTVTGRQLALVAAGSTVAILDATKDAGAPLLQLDAAGIDELIALLMRAAERIDGMTRTVNACCGNVGTRGEGGREYCASCGQENPQPRRPDIRAPAL